MAHKSTSKRFHVRIELKHIKPLIWREVIVPADISLGCLHNVIQLTMGWDDTHLHEFEHKGRSYGVPMDNDFTAVIDEATVALSDLFKRKGSRMRYTYDFGDEWEHDVSLIKTLPANPNEAPFTYVAGERTCPLEDCGGPWGFTEYLELKHFVAEKGEAGLEEDQLLRLEWFGEFSEILASTHAKRVDTQIKKIKDWQAGPAAETDEFDDGHEIDDEEFDDFLEFMESAADSLSEGFEFDEEDEEPMPEPYATLSADEAGDYARTMRLAEAVRRAEPWKTLYDQDIFGIEDPDTGELDIVSVLGGAKTVYSVQVYRPPNGLYFWKVAIHEPESMTTDFVLANSRMVEAEFTNKREMEPHDLALYTNTATDTPGKGRQQWIRFRSYAPRRMPWFGEHADLPALDRGLRLSLRFLESVRARGGAQMLPDPATDGLPVFRHTGGSTNDPENWELSHISVDWSSCQAGSKVYQPTEFELAHLASFPKCDETWELGSVFLPNPVATEEGPVICVLSIVASHAPEAEAPQPHLDSDPNHLPAQALWNSLAEATKARGCLPTELRVSSDHAFETLSFIAEEAGIHLKQFERCELVGPMLQMISMMPPPER